MAWRLFRSAAVIYSLAVGSEKKTKKPVDVVKLNHQPEGVDRKHITAAAAADADAAALISSSPPGIAKVLVHKITSGASLTLASGWCLLRVGACLESRERAERR